MLHTVVFFFFCSLYLDAVWSFRTLLIFGLPFCHRVPRCPCPDPAAGKVWGTAVTQTTGERGTAPAMACRVTPSSPPLSAAPRGSRTNLVSVASFCSVFATRTNKYCPFLNKICKHQGHWQFTRTSLVSRDIPQQPFKIYNESFNRSI